jgi:S1-C subfamily serine protease
MDKKQLARMVRPSVVLILGATKDGKVLGSGFAVRPNWIVTNFHVMEGVYFAGFRTADGRIGVIKSKLACDLVQDLALLETGELEPAPGRPPLVLPVLDLGPRRPPEQGEDVFAFGNPEGLQGTMSAGIVSSAGPRRVGNSMLLQINAAISQGSSGGPVVDSSGRVVGVVVSSTAHAQSLNFAVPVGYVHDLIDGPELHPCP